MYSPLAIATKLESFAGQVFDHLQRAKTEGKERQGRSRSTEDMNNVYLVDREGGGPQTKRAI